MKRLMAAVAGLALLVGAGVASAEEASGTIQAIDAAKRTITLDSGEDFKLDPAVTLATLRMGAKVTVSYVTKGGQNVATKIVPASASGSMGKNPPAGNTGPAMREAPGIGK